MRHGVHKYDISSRPGRGAYVSRRVFLSRPGPPASLGSQKRDRNVVAFLLVRPCAALGELKVARIHDIRFILCLGRSVCVQRSKGATTDKLQLNSTQ